MADARLALRITPSGRLGAFFLSQNSLLLQANVSTTADNDVIEHLDAQESASLNCLLGEHHVLRGRRRIARGVETAMLVVAKFIDGRTLPLLFKQPS